MISRKTGLVLVGAALFLASCHKDAPADANASDTANAMMADDVSNAMNVVDAANAADAANSMDSMDNGDRGNTDTRGRPAASDEAR
jgi:hypothetical protein